MNSLHAFDLFRRAKLELPRNVCVVHGDQRFLKLLVLKTLCPTRSVEDFSALRLDGQVEWPVLMDELMSHSLFGGGQKYVVIDYAEDFVKKHRERLEELATKSSLVGSLILLVDSWPATTRLFKLVAKNGLQVDCNLPEIKKGRTSVIDSQQVFRWLADYSKEKYQLTPTPVALRVLCELADFDLGRIDSELSKLALYVKPGETVNESLVHQHVGGWRTQTMWDAADAIASGNSARAILLLDRLLQTGEHPLALYGQLSWALRRFPKAVENYERLETTRERPPLLDALRRAGFRDWGDDVPNAERVLKRIGRLRAGMLGPLLLQIDLALKGSHSKEERARLLLEGLVFSLHDSTTHLTASKSGVSGLS